MSSRRVHVRLRNGFSFNASSIYEYGLRGALITLPGGTEIRALRLTGLKDAIEVNVTQADQEATLLPAIMEMLWDNKSNRREVPVHRLSGEELKKILSNITLLMDGDRLVGLTIC